MPDVRYLLWDFGDTLADQRWMWPNPPGVPGWTARYQALPDTDIDTRWSVGEMTSEELAAVFAADLECAPEVLMTHMEQCCASVRFFDHAWAAARARSATQAIVTVNSDIFSRFVVRNYALDSTFDVIVTSWEEHTRDKADLCQIALERLGGHDPAEGLLIDNIEENVDAWRARGGQGYWFQDDDEFGRDVAGLLPAEHA